MAQDPDFSDWSDDGDEKTASEPDIPTVTSIVAGMPYSMQVAVINHMDRTVEYVQSLHDHTAVIMTCCLAMQAVMLLLGKVRGLDRVAASVDSSIREAEGIEYEAATRKDHARRLIERLAQQAAASIAPTALPGKSALALDMPLAPTEETTRALLVNGSATMWHQAQQDVVRGLAKALREMSSDLDDRREATMDLVKEVTAWAVCHPCTGNTLFMPTNALCSPRSEPTPRPR